MDGLITFCIFSTGANEVKKALALLIIALTLVIALGSCKLNSANTTIVGTWSLATIQGVPVGYLTSTSGSLIVSSGMTFTQQLTLSGTAGSSTGSVTDNGSNNFTFVYTGDPNTAGYAATMSSDGKTLSFPSLSFFGAVTWSN